MAAGSDSPVATHYGRPGIVEAIDAALAAADKSPDDIRIEDLAPVDNFHLRGLEATRELAQLARAAGTDEVLDIDGGIGGPTRMLAATFGCRVTVLDLRPEFCRAGEELTRRMGLDDRVKFRLGDALQPPFPAASFDLVWTQHSSMNMPDKPALYAAARRLLRQGGRLAVHEITVRIEVAVGVGPCARHAIDQPIAGGIAARRVSGQAVPADVSLDGGLAVTEQVVGRAKPR